MIFPILKEFNNGKIFYIRRKTRYLFRGSLLLSKAVSKNTWRSNKFPGPINVKQIYFALIQQIVSLLWK